MASHKITVQNGQVSGLTDQEANVIFSFATKSGEAQSAIVQIASKVQEAIDNDARTLATLVESGKIDADDALILLDEYAEISANFSRLDEGIVADVKDAASDAYAKAGVYVTKAQQAIGKGLRNVLDWMKRHPKLTVGLTVAALLLVIPTQAFASSPISYNVSSAIGDTHAATSHTFYATSGVDLGTLADLWVKNKDDPTMKQKLFSALSKIGTNSVLVLPNGQHVTGDTADILTALVKVPDANGVVLLSQNPIPGTFEASLTKAAVQGIASGSVPIPGVNF
jgi:hypothetical protein